MDPHSVRSAFSSRQQNVGKSERWASALAGAALTMAAARRGGLLGRLAMGTAALSLLTRGATGYCAMKGALKGETTLKQGLREQWQRVRAGMGGGAAAIDSMDAMYVIELQELHSAEQQLGALVEEVGRLVGHAPLAVRLDEYAAEIRARAGELQQIIVNCGADPRRHPDQAMQALINETHKMAQVCAENVRDAALVASLQRIVHYKIAGYGTIASYAKALGRVEEAGLFAALADRDKAIDTELTELAKGTLNPEAAAAPTERSSSQSTEHSASQSSSQTRTH